MLCREASKPGVSISAGLLAFGRTTDLFYIHYDCLPKYLDSRHPQSQSFPVQKQRVQMHSAEGM